MFRAAISIKAFAFYTSPTGLNKYASKLRRARWLLGFCMAIFMCGCATVDTQHSPTKTVATSETQIEHTSDTQPHTKESGTVDKETESRSERVAEVAGAVVSTVATIWMVAEFVEEKVVPAALGLTIAYLLYQAARNNESREDNQSMQSF